MTLSADRLVNWLAKSAITGGLLYCFAPSGGETEALAVGVAFSVLLLLLQVQQARLDAIERQIAGTQR